MRGRFIVNQPDVVEERCEATEPDQDRDFHRGRPALRDAIPFAAWLAGFNMSHCVTHVLPRVLISQRRARFNPTKVDPPDERGFTKIDRPPRMTMHDTRSIVLASVATKCAEFTALSARAGEKHQ